MGRIRWLDGLQGIAAIVVAFNHYFNGEIQAPFRSFWDDPPENNRLVFQLFPIRLIFAVYGMVPFFMVIAGYAMSAKFLRLSYTAGSEIFLFHHLQTAAIRKFLRIYLLVLALAVLSQLLYFCGLFNWNFPDNVLRGTKPWKSPREHVLYVARYLLDNMDIVIFQWNEGHNGQV
ncbi:hypothetical protein PV08_04588 [Exophiala spinifera]|uniref:Acyltransferase 3 domain-containing protein n=1 Tax=Exophiala spinifera TaxID=91928 RepID=A0A0D2C133_9EURO|nr:uncharacterized protein PV08_04588 [Exophiala spinifera]KIW17394.1 hypothetical protein PV08_04588 [Exophiala spinifera]